MTCPLRPSLVTDSSAAAYAKSFATAQPFGHVVLEELCQNDRMRLIQTELLKELNATFKETDL